MCKNNEFSGNFEIPRPIVFAYTARERSLSDMSFQKAQGRRRSMYDISQDTAHFHLLKGFCRFK